MKPNKREKASDRDPPVDLKLFDKSRSKPKLSKVLSHILQQTKVQYNKDSTRIVKKLPTELFLILLVFILVFVDEISGVELSWSRRKCFKKYLILDFHIFDPTLAPSLIPLSLNLTISLSSSQAPGYVVTLSSRYFTF